MSHKTYFAVPNFDYPPNHSILLGQIISSPSEPWKRLSPPLPIPEKLVQCTRKANWGTELDREREQRMGIWAQFAAMILGIGADALVAWSRQNSELFQFDELETTMFDPDQDYVQASVIGPERTNVSDWIKQNHRSSVYMVTGLKVARGAKHLKARATGIDFEFSPGVDATAFTGVPISAGPQVGASRETGETTWFTGSDDFVFAYRLRRIIIKRQVVRNSKEYVKGATVAHEDHDGPAAIPKPSESDSVIHTGIQSVEQSRSDYGSGGYSLTGFVSSQVRDEQDDEECLLQIRENMLQEH